MGSSTITGLLPTLYEALDIVSRELVGFIPAVSRDTSAERAALGQQILVPITTAQAAQDVIPGVTPPDTGDQTINNVAMTITKSKMVPIRWNGEQQRGLRNAGEYEGILRNQFAQGFRTLANLIETDLFNAAYQNASRAYGTPGTAPFGIAGDLSDSAQLRKLLDDNGAPQTDLQLVTGSAAVANLRGKQTILLKANENGSDAFRRSGAIAEIPLDGFTLHNSNAIQAVAKGTGAGYVTSGDTAPGVNQSVLVTGTGTVLAGDVIQYAGDANNKYVVNTGVTGPGTITLGNPGVRQDEPTGTAITIGNAYTPNVGFSKSAMQLIARPPATPLDESGRPMDSALDSMILTDPFSGLSFEVSMYAQYKQIQYQVAIAWGVAAIKSNHIAILQG